MNRTCVSLVALTLVLAGACKKDNADSATDESNAGRVIQDPSTPPDNSSPDRFSDEVRADRLDDRLDERLLGLVPADSPFLFAALRPLPDGFVKYLEKGVEPLIGFMELGMGVAKEEMDPLGRAVLAELEGNLSRAGLYGLGIDMTPRFAIYAIGWSLAMRIELADGPRFSALIDRIEKNGRKAMVKAEFGGVSYRTFENPDSHMAMVLAVIGNDLVFGLMHANARDKVLPVLLGQQKPVRSLADAGTVRGLINQYKLLGIGMWFIDSEAIARMVTGQASGLSKQIIDATNVGDEEHISAICRAEIIDMTRVAPRLVFGYQSANKDGYDGVMSIELRRDIAQHLMSLSRPSKDISRLITGKPLAAMGMAIELDEAKQWLTDTVKEMMAAPYQCEHLKDLNREMPEFAAALQEPLPAFVSGARGVAMVVKSVNADGPMPTGEAFVAVGMDNPGKLFAMAKTQLPQLANTSLERGKTTTVPIGMPGLKSIDMRMEDSWLGAALGASMTEAMTSFLATEGRAGGPFFTMAYDYKRIMEVSQAMNPQSSTMDAAMANIMGNLMGYNSMSLSFTETGVIGQVHTRAH